MWGKRDWIREHVDSKIMIIFDNEKENYATASSLLIDDRNDKLAKFKEAGGLTLPIQKVTDLHGCYGIGIWDREPLIPDETKHIYFDMDGCLTDLQKSLKSLMAETMNSLL